VSPFVLGVVADTHGTLCRDTRDALAESDAILRAGDIGSASLLDELRSLAPVVAVVGNGDPELASEHPWEQRVELSGHRLLLCHWYDNFGRIHPTVERELADYRPHVLVYGHTHEAVNERRGECLFFNPGYAGPPRAGRPRSVGRLRLADGVSGEIIALPDPVEPPGAPAPGS
jgi:putative phosphoesterase